MPETVTESDIHKRLDKVEKDGREGNRKLQALRDQLEEDKAKEKTLEQKIQVGYIEPVFRISFRSDPDPPLKKTGSRILDLDPGKEIAENREKHSFVKYRNK